MSKKREALSEKEWEEVTQMTLNQAKKAILYEKITDYVLFNNRTSEQMITDIQYLNPDIIFRAFWQWNLVTNSCKDLPIEYQNGCYDNGSSYESFKNAVSIIKQSVPSCIIIGAVPSQVIMREVTYNPKSNTLIQYPETWAMALDPAKWSIPLSKTQLQCDFAKGLNWYPKDGDCNLYNPETAWYYFPDITNIQYQEILLSWIYTQIDNGADGIWIDMLVRQLKILYNITNDANHPSILDTISSIENIVSNIHTYGDSIGKSIYVGTWATISIANLNNPIDFLTVSPSYIEVSSMAYDTVSWIQKLNTIRNKYPTTPIICFIDWANNIDTPLAQFSQVLTSQQQKEFLSKSKEFCDANGLIFAYPVHGGWMMDDPTILSFGIRKEYDSKAIEFDTYNTINYLLNGCPQTNCNFTIS